MKSKIFVRSAVSCIIIAAMFILTAAPLCYPVVAQSNQHTNNQSSKAKSGPEVAARVKALKESSKSVREALKAFETKGHKPKIEDSSAITGTHASNKTAQTSGGNSVFFQNASFMKKSEIGDDYVEMIWVPTLSIEYEWQGTAIANRYDAYGNLIDQYVANIVMVMPDHNTYSWDVVYEVPYYEGAPLEPIYEPGMYTYVDLGTPLSDQQNQLQQQLQMVSKRDKAGAVGNVQFTKAKALVRWRGGWRAWGKCSAAWGGGSWVGGAAGCGLANWWNAEILWGPCTVVAGVTGTIAGAIGCTYGTLWD